MQFEISDRAAIAFAEELYTGLIGRRDPIDAAVAEARKAIYSDVDRVEWATPVLFVRDPDVQLFAFEDAASTPAWWRARLRPLVIAPVVAALAVGGTLALQGRGGEADRDPSTTTTTTTPATTTVADPVTNAGLPFPSVSVGDEGAVIVALQHLLVEHGFDVEVSGFFDDATEDAVQAVEADTNIPVDGTVGRVTWQQLAAPIRRGDQGPAVLGAEQLLALLGSPITPDERFTNRTQDLVTEFQRTNGLAVDGIVDIDTWRVLLALVERIPAAASSGALPGATTPPT